MNYGDCEEIIKKRRNVMMGAMGESPFFSKDIAVIVGGKTYRPDSVEVTQDPFEDATVKIEFRMSSFRSHFRPDSTKINPLASIEKVIFNPPATIVLWNDGTKTVVKAQDDEPFDPEKGLTMAIAKKYLGNKGNYFNQIKKWTEPYYEMKTAIENRVKEVLDWQANDQANFVAKMSRYLEKFNKRG
jgi:hypothetical protein